MGWRSPRSRTWGCRAAAAAGSSTRTRRPTTSPSSRRRRAISARGSSAAAAARVPRRSPRFGRRSRSSVSRASPFVALDRDPAEVAAIRPCRSEDAARAQARRGRMVRVRRARPAQGDEHGVDALRRREAQGLRRRRRGGHQRQPDGPRAALRARWPSMAIERTTGIETIPHVTPRDASMMGLQSQLLGAHARRDPQRARGDGRSAACRRLPRLERRVRDRRDRPHAAAHAAEPRRGLLRKGDRRADLVLRRRRREPVRGGPRLGDRALPAQARRGREIRDDAGALRHGLPRRLFDKIGDAADADPRRHLARAELRARVPAPQRGARDHDPRVRPEAARRRGPGRAKVGLELARGLLEQARTRASGVYVIPPFKEPAAALDLLA